MAGRKEIEKIILKGASAVDLGPVDPLVAESGRLMVVKCPLNGEMFPEPMYWIIQSLETPVWMLPEGAVRRRAVRILDMHCRWQGTYFTKGTLWATAMETLDLESVKHTTIIEAVRFYIDNKERILA